MPSRPVDVTRLDPTTLHVDGPAALIQTVPYLLGFHPQASVVLVGMVHGHVAVTARIDTAALTEPRVVGQTVRALGKGGADELIAVAYLDDGEPELSTSAFVELLNRAGMRYGCKLLDVLVVAHGMWHSLMCSDPVHCAFAGGELGPADSILAASATYAGLAALPDRAALVALFAPAPDRGNLEPLIDAEMGRQIQAIGAGRYDTWQRSAVRALFAAARRAPTVAPLTDRVLARFGVALRCVDVRDPVWLAIDDGRLDGLPLWQELSRRLPTAFDAPPAFLGGWAAWRAGNGALARIAVERALTADPDYRAADLLLSALDRALDPRSVPRLGAGPGRRRRQSARTKT
jgi:hypothetical protein